LLLVPSVRPFPLWNVLLPRPSPYIALAGPSPCAATCCACSKAVEGAQNQAKIDVAEAKMKGDIGEKQRTGLTRQEVSRGR